MVEIKTIEFTLEDVKGTLSIQQGVIGQVKVFQNGQEIKKNGTFRAKYPVATNNGSIEEMELKRDISFSYSVIFRKKEIRLEENLSPIEYILGLAPLVFLIITGGAIGAIIGMIGLIFLYNFMRIQKSLPIQILVTIGIGGICWLLAILVAFLLSLIVALFV